ncbi:hypothetical protein M413DRAFT_248977 [Hebeloma cylindrosporum]|uniref:Uncharacterized protein n=1 Tax=Hebeloma cylindrosporum TaxID=76867 RepID=A0A0C3C3W2_HEBCY|nr:hypothetical protein M413DRAFT_248977 [Hebeloma cylindrosporum h7]
MRNARSWGHFITISHPVTAPPYYPHYGATTSYGPPWAYNSFTPVYPPMGADMMYPGYYDVQSPFGQPLPQATVNNINSGNVSNVRISNVGNNNHGTGSSILFVCIYIVGILIVKFFVWIVARSIRKKRMDTP